MSMTSSERKLRVVHETTYRYGTRVEIAYHLAHLRPRQDTHQQVGDFRLQIEPAPSQRVDSVDVFGNVRTFFSLYVPHDSLAVRNESRVTVTPRFDGIDPAASPDWEGIAERLRYVAQAPFEPAVEFTFASPFVPLRTELGDYAAPSFPAGRPLLVGAMELMHRIHADFTYESGSTDVTTPVLDAFVRRRGVCQDYAHVMLGCLRALGLPARYVSGYLLTCSPAGAPRLLGADASHAWVSVWCPQFGWVDLDPTNDVLGDTAHVRLAFGRDYGDVIPLRGVIRGGGDHVLTVGVSVVPDEPTRVATDAAR
jgi:transglutaminase-like putative cysteine protease